MLLLACGEAVRRIAVGRTTARMAAHKTRIMVISAQRLMVKPHMTMFFRSRIFTVVVPPSASVGHAVATTAAVAAAGEAESEAAVAAAAVEAGIAAGATAVLLGSSSAPLLTAAPTPKEVHGRNAVTVGVVATPLLLAACCCSCCS